MKVNSSTIAEIDREVVKDELFLKVTFKNGNNCAQWLYKLTNTILKNMIVIEMGIIKMKAEILDLRMVGAICYNQIFLIYHQIIQ